MRSIDSRIWSDGWIRKLNALDRYLFLYLLTNDHSTWCGVYELDISMMAFESGIDREDLERSMLPRLSPKAIYVEGWVYVPNWVKYHQSESGNMSPQQKKGLEAAWAKVPENIRTVIKEIQDSGIPYAYPIGGVSASASAFTSTSDSAVREERVLDEEKPKRESKAKYPNAKEVFRLFGKYPAPWERHTTFLADAQWLYEEKGMEELSEMKAWYDKNRKREFCPQFDDPHEWVLKYKKVDDFFDKITTNA